VRVKQGVGLTVGGVLIVVSGAVLGLHACTPAKDTQEKVADRVVVAKPFVKIRQFNAGDSLDVVYLGPPIAAASEMMASPEVAFTNMLLSGSDKLFDYLGTADVGVVDGKDCTLELDKLKAGVAPMSYQRFSNDQRKQVIDGRRSAYELTISCG
jgi:hypothetical protein